MSDDELPELASVILRPTIGTRQVVSTHMPAPRLRRSPRKQKDDRNVSNHGLLEDIPELYATSQQRTSPQKQSSPRHARLGSIKARSRNTLLDNAPSLASSSRQKACLNERLQPQVTVLVDDNSEDDLARLLKPLSSLSLHTEDGRGSSSDKEIAVARKAGKAVQPTSRMSRVTQAARQQSDTRKVKRNGRAAPKISNPYVLKEAHCEDLNESSGTDGEDEDTDLSGFIVDDDAEISFHGSIEEVSSDSEREHKRKQQSTKRATTNQRRRLVRGGRRQLSDPEGNSAGNKELLKALGTMHLGDCTLEDWRNADRKRTLEVIDLTSSPPHQQVIPELEAEQETKNEPEHKEYDVMDPFSSSNRALKLLPSNRNELRELSLEFNPTKPNSEQTSKQRKPDKAPATPPATPPRSPTKLKSPTKLLSPSKRAVGAAQSSHRQSMDAFWDHNVVNQWHDVYSPKKAPTLSPRKNPLARFNLYAADDDISDTDDNGTQPTTSSSQDPFEDSLDSLPSPAKSPAKSRSPSKVSALKAEQVRIREEKQAKVAAKREFDAKKQNMALEMLLALDMHVTSSKISDLSASTGGVKILWSKTLRSTAGRAVWKRTVEKPSGSPMKGNPDNQSIERQPGVIVRHFASIELAEKVIDRPERLVNTLAHEFCHLANFMVSGIRDQPHGESFKRWASKVTKFLCSSEARKAQGWQEEWQLAAVTTKHSYIIEHKYLWACTGRPAASQKQSLAMKMLNIEAEDEESCGAEYGRHSKSIDVDKVRCGRCRGFLVQVRPTPRIGASPKKSPVKRNLTNEMNNVRDHGISGLEKLMDVVELSD